MSIGKLLNPVNWFKSAAASFADDKIDETVTLAKGKELLVDGVNKAVTLTEKSWDDDKCRTMARGFKLAGKAFSDLGEAIDPDGEDGRKLSVQEFELLLGDAQAAFGVLVSEEWVKAQRERLKAIVHEKLGV